MHFKSAAFIQRETFFKLEKRKNLANLVYRVIANCIVGWEMKIRLNPNMLTMHRKLAAGSSVSAVVDKDAGNTAHDSGGWFKCATSAVATKRDNHWLAIDLKGVFLISTVRAAFRYKSGTNATVFVVNNPSVNDGHDDYQCGSRWLTNVMRAPHFHNFVCQQPRWASHVSVQRNYFGDSPTNRVLQICEVEVYYIDYSTVGTHFVFYNLTQPHTFSVSYFTQESMLLSLPDWRPIRRQ